MLIPSKPKLIWNNAFSVKPKRKNIKICSWPATNLQPLAFLSLQSVNYVCDRGSQELFGNMFPVQRLVDFLLLSVSVFVALYLSVSASTCL